MHIGEIILISLGVVALAADVVVRLIIAPDRRDKLLDTLLESIMEPEDLEDLATSDQAAEAFPDPLARSLFRHFEQSGTSRHILRVLADNARGISEAELLARVNVRLAERHKPPLPPAVVHRVLRIMESSHLITGEGGQFALTAVGAQLNRIVKSPLIAAALASPALASR